MTQLDPNDLQEVPGAHGQRRQKCQSVARVLRQRLSRIHSMGEYALAQDVTSETVLRAHMANPLLTDRGALRRACGGWGR